MSTGHAHTSTQGGKISFGTIRMAGNGSEWMGMDRNGSEWIGMDGNGSEWMGMDRNGSEWMGMDWEWMGMPE